MWSGYPSFTIREKNVAVLHIYGGKAISLLFCVHQDTESELLEMDIIVAAPILTQE